MIRSSSSMLAGVSIITVFGVVVTVSTLLTRNGSTNSASASATSIRSELQTASNTSATTTNNLSIAMTKTKRYDSGVAATEATTEVEAIVSSLQRHEEVDIVSMEIERFVKNGSHQNNDSNKAETGEGTRGSKQESTSTSGPAAVVASTSSGTRVTGFSYFVSDRWNDGAMFSTSAISTLMVIATLMFYMVAFL